MLNDLIRDFVLKLPDSIRSEICFRLVLFIDLGRLTPDDIEKVTGELLTPSDSFDRFRALVLAAGILDFVFATLFSEADTKLLQFLASRSPTVQTGFARQKDFAAAQTEWNRFRANELSSASIRDQQKNSCSGMISYLR
jgi:hypothetical protein